MKNQESTSLFAPKKDDAPKDVADKPVQFKLPAEDKPVEDVKEKKQEAPAASHSLFGAKTTQAAPTEKK